MNKSFVAFLTWLVSPSLDEQNERMRADVLNVNG